ncbi:DNA gyrase (subunit B) GyrB (DNA topoisomerase) [Mycobacteroides abscessus]|nr:DNA gyrase (subunit B) GyrB (DNA topoisomerase) [Mycobacteroides abscessus]
MAAQKKSAKSEYSADSITILEGLEAVRKRPGCISGPPESAACTT